MKKLLVILVMLVSVFTLSACQKESETIRFASIGPLTGQVSVYGNAVKEGIELAVEEINAAGGITLEGGVKKLVSFEMLDDEHDGDNAKAAFNTLNSKGIDVLLGAVTSAPTEAVIGEAIKTGVPMITPTATADHITVGNPANRAARSNVFRACFFDSFQGQVMANFAATSLTDVESVAILYNSSDAYSTGLKDAFVAKAAALDLNTTAIAYTSGTSDFSSQVIQVTSGSFGAVFIPDYYEAAANILTTLRGAGYTAPCLGVDGWDGVLEQFATTVDKAVLENCYFSNHYATDDTSAKVQSFITAYEAKYSKTPNALAVLGYDAAYIAKAAIEEAGSVDYEAVIAALNTITVDAVTGNITYDDNGNPIKNAAIITFDSENDYALKFHLSGTSE
ncbi:MAG: ABC transporter substrate-binding protein [Bacilli bacterium]|nr:ABC transporter substrate-binding protein [Bacilli bacterium]